MTQFVQRIRSLAPRWLKQAVKFGLVGVLNTVIDAVLYFLLTRFVGFFITRQVIAKVISYTAGVINSFVWNRAWTFRSSTDPRRTFVPFFLSNLVGVAINAGVMYVGLSVFGLHDVLAFLLATAVTLGWNFVVSKFVVFRG